MKKQISVLAGSLLAAAGSQAITVGGDVLAVFSTAGAGTFYQVVDTTADLLTGDGFSVDVSAAAAFLGGTIESFAVIAIADGTNTYNYSEFIYVDNGGGLITAGAPAASTNLALGNQIFNIEAFLANATLGGNGEGSLGDFDGNANVASLLTSGATGLAFNQFTLGSGTAASALSITSPAGSGSVELVGTTFSATGVGGPNPVPVPAAAWLFGSALLGLGVVRRK